MPTAAPKYLAFDLYGTLLDTSSIKATLEQLLIDEHKPLATQIVQAWRKYQLEYTWRLNSMGSSHHCLSFFRSY
jgi:2-haloacid dehalogenase